jgi:uncharacterized protein YbjT (DUF2867 family)
MERVLVFGATGNLGRQIIKALKQQHYYVASVVRSSAKAALLQSISDECLVADITVAGQLKGICNGFDLVISALGKSVSIEDKSKPSFEDIDYKANAVILQEAKESQVKKFVYISALHAEQYPHLAYFNTHYRFSQLLKNSGVNYSIIKPPALFSAFLDLVPLAKKGRLVHMGKGDKRTNPIYEGDLAEICVASIHQPDAEIEVGGKQVMTRREINETIRNIVAPGKKIPTISLWLVRSMLPMIKPFNRNLFDKLGFFVQVMQDDVLAPEIGERRLEDYIKESVAKP